MNTDSLTLRIDAILPQTQCGQCGYTGCKPYAEALANGEADINQCPPGGDDGIHSLAQLLGRVFKPLNPQHGAFKPKSLAVIDEEACIGCTLCIQACPVDAIIGASKQMHTVIASECTGCELCLPPCPVDCIRLEPLSAEALNAFDTKQAADIARQRYEFRQLRLARDQQAKQVISNASNTSGDADIAASLKKAAIAAAMAKAKLHKDKIA